MSKPSIHIDHIRANANDFVFVAMDFAPKYLHIYEDIIATAVIDCGMTAIRSDNISSPGRNIIDELIDVVRLCRAVIVDISGLNANVLIECGIVKAFNK